MDVGYCCCYCYFVFVLSFTRLDAVVAVRISSDICAAVFGGTLAVGESALRRL